MQLNIKFHLVMLKGVWRNLSREMEENLRRTICNLLKTHILYLNSLVFLKIKGKGYYNIYLFLGMLGIGLDLWKKNPLLTGNI